MILGLGAAFCYCDDFASIIRSLGEKLEKCSLGDVVRAGASDQIPARLEDLHRPEVDFLVAALRGGNAIAILGEGGRIENDHVEPAILIVMGVVVVFILISLYLPIFSLGQATAM